MTKPRLLLADDSVTIRKVVELTFAEEGIEVISVGDGDAAMQKFVEQTPDIVLVDVEMPGMNGYKLCEMIKQDEVTHRIPVMLLVGSFEPFDQAEAERVHADGVMMKPFNSIRDLVTRVSGLLADASFAAVVTPDTADIEELYSSSFAETVPLHDIDTEEDALVEDELIEASSVPSAYVDDESLVDDEMVETISLSGTPSTNGDVPASVDSLQETIKDFDWSPAAMVENNPVEQPVAQTAVAETGFELKTDLNGDEPQRQVPFIDHLDPAIHDSKADTEEVYLPSVFPEMAPAEPPKVLTLEPKEELIEMIAKRVVDRLSDQAIRDVAREAVPRIAEKLIREALEDERKV